MLRRTGTLPATRMRHLAVARGWGPGPSVAMGRSTIMILGEREEDADGNNWEQVLAVGTIEP